MTHPNPYDSDDMTEPDDQPTAEAFEQMAQRIDQGADRLDYQADHAAEILPGRMDGDRVDPQQWAAEKRQAAEAARQYAGELRADAGNPTSPEAGWDRLAQADLIAASTDSGGTLIDGRSTAERNLRDSDSVWNRAEHQSWQDGTHPAQEKARQVESTGLFTHVAETIDGVEQVPFWKLGGATDESTNHAGARRGDQDADEA